jgi:MtN3 and saliva related transmembrane protein
MDRHKKLFLALLGISFIAFSGCDDLVPRDVPSLLVPTLHRSEIIGFLAGFGTTFAAVPDLVSMLKRRSSAGMNPRMAAIMCVFQILWVYYGLLIASRPVIAWNLIAVFTNSLSVGAYVYFVRKERQESRESSKKK